MSSVFQTKRILSVFSFCRSWFYSENTRKEEKTVKPINRLKKLSKEISQAKVDLEIELAKKDNQDPEIIYDLQEKLRKRRKEGKKLLKYVI